jgi:hypothetical protein
MNLFQITTTVQIINIIFMICIGIFSHITIKDDAQQREINLFTVEIL